jgi:hypothetical protein
VAGSITFVPKYLNGAHSYQFNYIYMIDDCLLFQLLIKLCTMPTTVVVVTTVKNIIGSRSYFYLYDPFSYPLLSAPPPALSSILATTRTRNSIINYYSCLDQQPKIKNITDRCALRYQLSLLLLFFEPHSIPSVGNFLQ